MPVKKYRISVVNEEKPPFTFDMGKNTVIPGLEKGLIGVKKNGKLTLIVPFDQAYGPHQEGPIPPYSTLVFNIEVLKVEYNPLTPALTFPCTCKIPECLDVFMRCECCVDSKGIHVYNLPGNLRIFTFVVFDY